jgi:hypothetical protein
MDKVQNIEINYDPLFYKTLIYFNKQDNINFQTSASRGLFCR